MPEPKDDLTYLFGGEIDAGEFSLAISSDDLEPNEITRMLGTKPTYSHRRGDSNRNGKIQFKHGEWRFATARLDFRNGSSCENSFDTFLRSLPDAPEVWRVIARDYEAQVFIHLWMKTWNREFDLSVFALGELARRQLRLHIDTYVDINHEDSAA